MIDKNDWRLHGQEKYLKGVTLYLKKYIKYRDAWDHDHCEFCRVKFSPGGHSGDLDEGYTTKDNYHWICKSVQDLERLIEFSQVAANCLITDSTER